MKEKRFVMKTLLTLTLASFALLDTSAAFAQTTNADSGWFVNGSVGKSLVSSPSNSYVYRGDSSSRAYGLNGGYRWALSSSLAIGAELGYSDQNKVDLKTMYGDYYLKLHSWNVGANIRFDLMPQWYLSGRTGISRWSNGHRDGNGWYSGVGTGYNFNQHVSLGLNFDHYEADRDLDGNTISVGAEYRF